jgi:hypothetical protein
MKLAKKESRVDPIAITRASRNGLLTATHIPPFTVTIYQLIKQRLSNLS